MEQWWQRTTAHAPAPGLGACLLVGLVVLVLIRWSPTWRVLRHVDTVVHEGGHGMAALLVGRRLAGIRLHSDSSGLTTSRGKPRGPGMVLTLLAGYPAPGLVGLAAAAVLRTGHAAAMLWALLGALALLLLQIRNFYGLWVVLVSGLALVAVTRWLDLQAQATVAYGVTWFLLLTAPRGVLDLQRTRRRSRSRTSDPDQLARITGLPAGLWVAVMLLTTLGCLVGGAWLLLAPVRT